MKEHIITALFKMLCNEIGFERANAIFDQAQINTDYDWPGRAEEAYRITSEHVPALAVCDKGGEHEA